MKNVTFIIFLLSSLISWAQEFDWEGKLSVSGLASNEETLPFWMYANSNYSRGTETNFLGVGELKSTYEFSNFFIEAGIAFYYRDEVVDEFQRRDLYLRFQNNWLKATLGAKRQELMVNGLSVTNTNFLWSGNARPIPGLLFEANSPIRIGKNFAIDWGIAHYELNDDRFVDNTNLHYKRLGFITTFNENHRVRLQIQHFAQWAGTSPVYGELNSDFEAFIDVFFARKSEEINVDGEIQNAVGNHLGTFLFAYDFNTNLGIFSVYHEHPFEDGSGTGFSNFPDGVWGVFYQPKKKKIITSFLYEYVDTRDQSSNDVSGNDNYFSNNVYRSGWTYEGNIIGLPLITADKSIVITEETSPIINNRVQAHHFGFSGTFKKIDWRLKSTISKNLGTYNHPFPMVINNWYNYADFSYTTQDYGTFTLELALDTSSFSDTNFGGGLSYSYVF
jgi:hypothetical protein